jgi:hypothetical protein
MALHYLADSQHTDDDTDTALSLLEAGIPLTLLLDLATPIRSIDVYRTEPGAADWLLAAGVA